MAQAETLRAVLSANSGLERCGGVTSDSTASYVNARELLAAANPGLVAMEDQSHAANLLLADVEIWIGKNHRLRTSQLFSRT